MFLNRDFFMQKIMSKTVDKQIRQVYNIGASLKRKGRRHGQYKKVAGR